jgi:UTP--glucose-1-phosphate uridylyltransferase
MKGLVEKPGAENAPSNAAVIGRYILQPEIFDHLETLGEGAGGEIQLTDAMQNLLGEQDFYGLRFEGTRYDCGTRLGFIEAHIAFSLNDPAIGKDVRRILERFAGEVQKARYSA